MNQRVVYSPSSLIYFFTSFAAERNYEIVELLLDFGAKPNVQDAAGDTPLHKVRSRHTIIYI